MKDISLFDLCGSNFNRREIESRRGARRVLFSINHTSRPDEGGCGGGWEAGPNERDKKESSQKKGKSISPLMESIVSPIDYVSPRGLNRSQVRQFDRVLAIKPARDYRLRLTPRKTLRRAMDFRESPITEMRAALCKLSVN